MDTTMLIELISATGQVGTGGIIAFGLWWVWSDRVRWWREWESARKEREVLLTKDRQEILDMWKETSKLLAHATNTLETTSEVASKLLDVLCELRQVLGVLHGSKP